MDPAHLVDKYQAKGVLLDTNLMVLLAVGLYKRERISSFKRTLQYTQDDFSLVARIVGSFARRITTPHILAEVDNLTRQLEKREYPAVAAILAPLIEEHFEIYFPSDAAARHERYFQLGLTDCITIAASENVLVITDDFPLSNILSHLGRDAININHIRTLNWT